MDYKESGVDIDAGAELVERIKPAVRRTHREGVVKGLGGFGAIFKLSMDRYTNPLLVSGTDGVGTKVVLAIEEDRHDDIGIDLVAMVANDLIVQGAEPLFFLDYYATGKLDLDDATTVINGIGRGCEMAGMALIGGETAEMPGMYGYGEYDLAGFGVGIVEEDKLITGENVQVGDMVIGLRSSGLHSNGYSLVRKILDDTGIDGRVDAILAPTRIYVKPILSLIDKFEVRSICHVTGGGITENLPRVLPDNVKAHIVIESWEWQETYSWLMANGPLELDEMLRTFNCGIGMTVIVPFENTLAAMQHLINCGEEAYVIGKIEAGVGPATVKYHETWGY
jgi:phosphoribosylformylglycinamidine cyclo-ligase